MKITITDKPQDNTYFVEIYDGPDGIDHATFVCGSLGEVFERITEFRMMNALTYHEPDVSLTDVVKSYFDSIDT